MTEASNKSVNLENIDSTSLFSESITDGGISELLDYSRNLSHWVSAEVLSCSSPKVGSKSHSCHHILWKVLTVCHRLWHKCKVFNIPGPRMSATWHSTLLRWTMASYQQVPRCIQVVFIIYVQVKGQYIGDDVNIQAMMLIVEFLVYSHNQYAIVYASGRYI